MLAFLTRRARHEGERRATDSLTSLYLMVREHDDAVVARAEQRADQAEQRAASIAAERDALRTKLSAGGRARAARDRARRDARTAELRMECGL